MGKTSKEMDKFLHDIFFGFINLIDILNSPQRSLRPQRIIGEKALQGFRIL